MKSFIKSPGRDFSFLLKPGMICAKVPLLISLLKH